MKMLFQLQLSNYKNGIFSLTGDSNWTTFIAKARQLVELQPGISIYVLVPHQYKVYESVYDELMRHGLTKNVQPYYIGIVANALVTRYDFNFVEISSILDMIGEVDVVYINDPCLVGNYCSVFQSLKYSPYIVSQCHFLDKPSNPLVPKEVSYWWRTLEACAKADLCVWHCETQLKEFLNECDEESIHLTGAKHFVWKSGHSSTMLNEPINMSNLRFDPAIVPHSSKVVWVPNRIGGLGKSFDYTNNGRFLFDEMPEYKGEQVIVLCGNPSQKITNDEIAERVPEYIKLVDGSLNYDEYKWCTQRADVVVALYNKDSNGGIAVLEAIHHGAVPLMPDINEYARYFRESNFPLSPRVDSELSNIPDALEKLLMWLNEKCMLNIRSDLQHSIAKYSIEETTKEFLKIVLDK